MAVFVLFAAVLMGCEAVAEWIPEGDPDLQRENPDRTAGPDATPILPNSSVGGGSQLPASAIPDHELALTVVQIRAIDASGEEPRVVRVGSGVIVDAEELLILTSYTLVQPYGANGAPAYTELGIAMAPEAGAEPEMMFEAEIAFADSEYQLAVLRIRRDFGGDSLTAERFTGKAAVFDGTAATTAGSPLRIFGHPAPSEDGSNTQPVSMTSATVTGFRSSPGHTGRTWIKTDVRLPAPLAGGPVFDQRGVLLGVLVQERYLPNGGVGHVRAMDLARQLIDSARQHPDARYEAPIRLHTNVSGNSQVPLDATNWVSQPLFAPDANDTITGRDLFDYTHTFEAGLQDLYYEFTVAGVQNGATIEERWYLDGLQQDSLSSSYVWDGGSFGYVSDRVTAAGDAGLPRGNWRLEIWVDGQLRARAVALIGVEVSTPEIDNTSGGATADSFGEPATSVEDGSTQLLAFFGFRGFEGAQRFSWSVYRNNTRVYQSQGLPWEYGDNGRAWVGYRPAGGPITSGNWEFEIFVDGVLIGTIPVEVP